MLKPNRKILLIALLFGFFILLTILYSWFNWSMLQPLSHEFSYQYIFNWPDAMVNNYFVDKFVDSGSFVQAEPLNELLNNIVRPRSLNIVDNNFVPSGFLGFIVLYGFLGLIFSKYAVIYFTPIIASVGVFVFYLFVKELINKRAALISTIILMFLAPYIFFANQTMLATIPFIVATLGGFYLLARADILSNTKKSWGLVCASGFLLGLAISIRYQEALWIVFSLLIIWLLQFKKISLKHFLLFILGFIIPLAIILLYNQQIYGEMFTVGYLRMNSTSDAIINRLPAEINVRTGNTALAYLKLIFLPFGFSARAIYDNVERYLLMPYGGHFLFILMGAFIWLKNFAKNNIKQKSYALCAIVSSLILITYYGSWVFVDQMVLQNNTISSSYTRYWLPVLIMLIPLIGYLLDQVVAKMNRKHYLKGLAVLILLGFYIVLSGFSAFTRPDDGLVAQARVTKEYFQRANLVRSIIEPDSLIVVEREDKLFFPTYKVILFEHDYTIFEQLIKERINKPIYYLSMNSDKDIEFINANKLSGYNQKWELVQNIDDSFRLFRLNQDAPNTVTPKSIKENKK
ncbi:MAG: hypothetical protein UT02_C0023G0004 [Parcubacteria group bacterium GW2011_GWC2_38_7]|nr:MAG: hypothetical protein UT02_C0023G0004 [Parcubacteria group bacterium GW2011_GWC2_38_7]